MSINFYKYFFDYNLSMAEEHDLYEITSAISILNLDENEL